MNLKPTRRFAFAAAAAGMATMALSGCLIADKQSQVITAAGSDTTENVMAALVAAENADTAYNTDPDDLQNVLSVEAAPKVVPGDANCATKTYHSPAGVGETLAPNGSSAGRNALKASVQAGDGCIDVARSSGPPRAIPSDLATFEYYAFGLDALGWASASTKAPANMTLSQLRGVYNCTFTDWSQVGGTAGPIQRYHPQTLSGTWQFFRDDLLGFDPTTFSGPSCPASIPTQENSGELIAANGDQEEALVGYSMANWVAQARGTAPEQRSGQTMRDLNGQNLVTFPGGVATPNTAGPVKETNVKLVNPTPGLPGHPVRLQRRRQHLGQLQPGPSLRGLREPRQRGAGLLDVQPALRRPAPVDHQLLRVRRARRHDQLEQRAGQPLPPVQALIQHN